MVFESGSTSVNVTKFCCCDFSYIYYHFHSCATFQQNNRFLTNRTVHELCWTVRNRQKWEGCNKSFWKNEGTAKIPICSFRIAKRTKNKENKKTPTALWIDMIKHPQAAAKNITSPAEGIILEILGIMKVNNYKFITLIFSSVLISLTSLSSLLFLLPSHRKVLSLIFSLSFPSYFFNILFFQIFRILFSPHLFFLFILFVEICVGVQLRYLFIHQTFQHSLFFQMS